MHPSFISGFASCGSIFLLERDSMLGTNIVWNQPPKMISFIPMIYIYLIDAIFAQSKYRLKLDLSTLWILFVSSHSNGYLVLLVTF